MKTNKTIISLVGTVVMVLCLMIYMFIYTYILNNNMDMCMNHYKDYDYCSKKVGE